LNQVFLNEGRAPCPRRHSSFCIHPSDFPRPLPGRAETFAFRFDLTQLFQEFIRRELREVWQSRGWTFHAQSCTRYLLCDETGNNRFKLVPDIRFETDTDRTRSRSSKAASTECLTL
jgi:hypothetical protein